MTKNKTCKSYKYVPFTGVGTKPPTTSGEYRIKTKKNQPVYIGYTNNLYREMKLQIDDSQSDNRTIFEWSLVGSHMSYCVDQ